MCFSAPVSLATSGGLAGLGFAAWRKAKKHLRLAALVPSFFAVQQAIEGLQWLALHPSLLSLIFGYAYLFFAFLFWPVYTPIVVRQMESNARRKKILSGFVVFGAAVALYLLGVLLTQPLSISLADGHVLYDIHIPFWNIVLGFYVFVVVAGMLASTDMAVKWLGALVFLSAFVAFAFFLETFISVWCFFAAVISTFVYLYIRWKTR